MNRFFHSDCGTLFLSVLGAMLLTAGAGNPCMASGFQFYEQGAKATAMGGAFTAQADDASAVAYNPAGITFLKHAQLYVGGTLTTPRASFDGENPFPGSGVSWDMKNQLFFPPTLYYVNPLSDRISVAIGVYSPFGLGTEWVNAGSFPGRYISTKADIRTIDINPVVGFKLSDGISVGGGVDIRGATVKLRRDVPLINPFTFQAVDIATLTLESDRNYGTGFNVGVLAKKSSWSFGVSYRHKIDLDQTGTGRFQTHSTGNPALDILVSSMLPQGALPVKTTINYPALVNAGVATTHFRDWTLEADVDWASWSNVDALDLQFPQNPAFDTTVVENWDDSWSFRFGAERRMSDRWAVRAGYVYDQSPVPPESIDPILPDGNRHGATFGIGYSFGKLQVDLAEMLLFFEKAKTNGTSSRGFDGTYSNFANLVDVTVSYHF